MVTRVMLATAGVAVLLSSLALNAESALGAPPLDRINSATIQSELIGYYKEAFNRSPDQTGFNHYVSLAAGSCSPILGNVGGHLFSAAEFTNRGLTTTSRVRALYRGLLNRQADSSGLNYWVGQLNAGTPWSTAVSGLISGAEYRNRVNHICYVHYGSNNTQFIDEANGLMALPFFANQTEFVRQRELRRNARGPYNWTTDGCSGPTWDQELYYDYRVCWRHDFGWRNYGKGLTMQRTEARRLAIDNQFRADMYESCDRRYGTGLTWALCATEADITYNAVRVVGW